MRAARRRHPARPAPTPTTAPARASVRAPHPVVATRSLCELEDGTETLTRSRSLDAGAPDAGPRSPDAGGGAPDAGGRAPDAGGGAPDAGGAGGAARACGVTGSFSSIPDGVTLRATLAGRKLGASFDMVGVFTPTDPACSAACGEYRQYVRGEFKRNGTAVVHRLCGTN